MGPTDQGFAFEDHVAMHAVIRGLRVDVQLTRLPFDLMIQGLRVQCKSLTRKKKGRLCLHATRRIMRHEFDVLALAFREKANEPFGPVWLVPMHALPGDEVSLYRDIRTSWLRENTAFENNWGVFDGVLSE